MRFVLQHDFTDLLANISGEISKFQARVNEEAKNIAVSTRAVIIAKAESELSSFQKDTYLGKDHENVRFKQLGEGIYLIELDDKANPIEDGSPKRFMRWLIENNPKAKTAKDGSRYAHIPFSHNHSGKIGNQSDVNDPKSSFIDIVNKTLKSHNIDMNKIDTNKNGSPKLGVLHKISPNDIIANDMNRKHFSMSRTQETAEKIGLKAHTGIHKLQGMLVTQRIDKKTGKAVKEVMTFRTISTKHEAEGRWYYPEIKPFRGIPFGFEVAKTQLDEAVKRLINEFGKK